MTAPTTPQARRGLPGPVDPFPTRHIGPRPGAIDGMLEALGLGTLEELVDRTVPASIRMEGTLQLGEGRGEHEALAEIAQLARRNQVWRSFLGLGYHGTITPPVVQRNVLENPGWYTQYTPYQAEISQGRLEALLNFQTMVSELCGLPLANASLLDEATAAAEAMAMCRGLDRQERERFFVADDCHPQTIAVVQTRAEAIGVEVVVGPADGVDPAGGVYFGLLLQSPSTHGVLRDLRATCEAAHGAGTRVVVATDLLACALATPPGELGADIAVGNSQRFGVPLGYGGPHAAFLACGEDFQRLLPGRIIGLSRDVHGHPALRMALQTREQHIRRDRATSNICTAQVLLAIMAGMYAVWHGPEGLHRIAGRVHNAARALAAGLRELGHDPGDRPFFDTLAVRPVGLGPDAIRRRASEFHLNLRYLEDGRVVIALDERCSTDELQQLLEVFAPEGATPPDAGELLGQLEGDGLPGALRRSGAFMQQEVFRTHRSEHEMLRYLHKLQARDLSLTHSMIPLGSCTMKLNATSEMFPVSYPGFAGLHPFAPADQAKGYAELFDQLERWLADITGFAAVSLQPNAGSQGEYAGLLTIRARHRARGEAQRTACLIPVSAHGTNPASAVMAGMRVVPVKCDERGNIDLGDLRAKAAANANELAALMVTYPSTHGVFEETIREVCDIVHEHGGLVYMDGANMNAQVGLCRPGDMGADVCHLNLHKTFCIPHGGGGPGMGPIGVTAELAPFLPGHPLADCGGEEAIGPVSAAPWGSPGILPISWMYIRMMGTEGLTRASQVAILNANYMAHRLRGHYDILYTGEDGWVAHEFILDCRPFKASCDISVDDIAKRLMDYGFHAPTMSWPVAGTLMVEPTESESRAELDRFCDAMIAIREEIAAIERGEADRADNPLKHAPHTLAQVTADEWSHAYTRQQAAFPAPWIANAKFWPSVGRVDNVYGDRNLVCTCPPMEEYGAAAEG